MKRKHVLIGVALLLSFAAQAGTIVKWGESGGDVNIVTGNANGPVTTNYPSTYTSPLNGTSGYDANASGQTRKYYGATDGSTFGLNHNGAGDRIQMVRNFGGGTGTVTSIIAWESPDFLLTNTEGLESFTIEFDKRGGTTTNSLLIETSAGWYQSDQTFANNAFSTITTNVAGLTWSPFSLFGVTGGVGPADTNDVVSVGAYFTSAIVGGNWSGGLLRYFEVTAVGGDVIVFPPSANDQDVALVENTSVVITLTGSDPDGSNLTYTVSDTTAHGDLVGATNVWTYTPDADYTGPDSFTFTVDNGTTNSAPATVSIDVWENRTVWENDMSASPVGDGWIYRNGTGTSSVTNGVLTMTADGTRIDTDPPNDFLGLTKLDVQWRATTLTTDAKERGASVYVVVSGAAPTTQTGLNFHATKLIDDTQTFRIFNGGTELAAVLGFSTNMLTLAATIDPDLATIDYIIGDETTSVTGSVAFVAKPVVEILPTLSTMLSFGTVVAEFDYIRIEANWILKDPYTIWAESYDLYDDDALLEADVEYGGLGDGLNNLMEYALGGNPTIDDAAIVSPVIEAGEDVFSYIYNRQNPKDPLLTYDVLSSADLVVEPVTNATTEVGASDVVDGFESVTNQVSTTVEDAQFMQLNVEMN